ncbi:MAG TPA: efflux RND transporter permease subunit [Sphingobacteriaceae bacterium]|nr:efflux RND transporter permease subunit [Sphingobacteriaceae bacterium]
MNLPKLSVTRPVFASVILIIIFGLGLFSLTGIPLDLLPEMNFPVAVVATSYSGAGPEEVETLVTRPIESAMATVSSVETVSSVSNEGSSLVVVQFNWGVNIDQATLDMREAIDMVRGFLPDGAGDPRVFKFDPSQMPIMTIGVAGPYDTDQVQAFVEDVVVPRLERIPGVAAVSVDGGRDREIQVRFDAATLAAHGIALNQVAAVLQGNNLNLPGGTVEEGARSYSVRVMGEFTSLEDIKSVVIPTATGAGLRLGDIAQVVDTHAEARSLTRLNGRPSLGLSIQKESGANTVNVSQRVHRELDRLQAELPPGFQFAVVIDQAEFILQSLRGMVNDTVLGAILAIVILWVFLRDWRSTMVIAIAIPFSVIATFCLIYFANITLNLLSLGGLALGVGMMVDNAIVVLENIFRLGQEGLSPNDAAIEGANEVAAAITASTLTTLSVFLPVVFLKGLAAEIFRDLSLTVSFSLTASLLVAITGIPMLASRLFRRGYVPVVEHGDQRASGKAPVPAIAGGSNGDGNGKAGSDSTGNEPDGSGDGAKPKSGRPGIADYYRHFLIWSLGNRRKVVAGMGGAIVLAILLTFVVDAEFLPSVDEGQIFVDAEFPAGTNLTEADRIMGVLEGAALRLPEAEKVFTYVGGSAGFGQPGGSGGAVGNGQVQIVLVPKNQRQRSTKAVADELRQFVATVPGARISIADTSATGMGMGGGSGSGFGGPPISITIKGDDLNVLRRLADETALRLEGIDGLRDVGTSFDEGLPELRVVVDRQRAAALGITPAQVAQTVRTAMVGQTVTQFRDAGTEVDVTIRLDDRSVADRTAIAALPVPTAFGGHVSLSTVAHLEEAIGPTSIARTDQSRIANVTAFLDGRPLGAVVGPVQEALDGIELPSGYEIEMGGEQETMADAFGSLTVAALMGFFLMYFIMAAQFESYIFPISVMLTVPMALVGIVFGLAITGRTFSAAAFVGLITVMGVIVNNAIVLVDYAGRLRRQGMPRDQAIVQAGTVRLRPILMTALTTILATLPLALGLGEGSEIQAPMATVVGSGLLVGTVLTLIVLPVLYTILDEWFGPREQRPRWLRWLRLPRLPRLPRLKLPGLGAPRPAGGEGEVT